MRAFIIFFCFLFEMFILNAQDNECRAPIGKDGFDGYTINGPVVYQPQAPVSITNNYVFPTENIGEVTSEIKVLLKLREQIRLDKLSLTQQEDLVKKELEKLSKERKEIVGMIQQNTETLVLINQTKKVLIEEMERLTLEFRKVVASSLTASIISADPITTKLEELKTKGEQIIVSSEKCFQNDFKVIPIKQEGTGKILYGFSLEEIRKDPNYILIDDYADGLARVKRSNKYGFFNQKGELVIEFKYDYVDRFNNGLAAVKNLNKWFLIDKSEKTLYSFSSKVVSVKLVEENSWFQISDDRGTCFADKTGAQKSAIYSSISPFNKYGLAEVSLNGSKGLINKKGELVIPCNFDKIEYWNYRFIRVLCKDTYGIYDMNGRKFLDCIYSSIVKSKSGHVYLESAYGAILADSNFIYLSKYHSIIKPFDTNEIAVVKSQGLYGLIDKEGKEVSPCKFVNEPKFNHNRAIVKNTKKTFGVIDSKGNTVVDFKYDTIFPFDKHKVAIVNKGSKLGVINLNGELITKIEFSRIDNFGTDGLANVEKEGYWGLINVHGKLIADCKYWAPFSNYEGTSLKLAQINNKYGLYSAEQNMEVLKCFYKEIKPMKGNIVVGDIGDCGQLDDFFYYKEGKLIKIHPINKVDCLFALSEEAKKLKNNLCVFSYANDSYYIFNSYNLRLTGESCSKITDIDRYGSICMQTSYSGGSVLIDTSLNIICYSSHCPIAGDNQTYLVNRNGNQYGFVNTKGNLIIDYIYEPGTMPFENGYSVVKKNNQRGVIDTNGLEFIPPIFDTLEKRKYGFIVSKNGLTFELNFQGNCISQNIEQYKQLVREYHQKK